MFVPQWVHSTLNECLCLDQQVFGTMKAPIRWHHGPPGIGHPETKQTLAVILFQLACMQKIQDFLRPGTSFFFKFSQILSRLILYTISHVLLSQYVPGSDSHHYKTLIDLYNCWIFQYNLWYKSVFGRNNDQNINFVVTFILNRNHFMKNIEFLIFNKILLLQVGYLFTHNDIEIR